MAGVETIWELHTLTVIKALWGKPEQAVCQVKSGLLLTSIDPEHTARLAICTGSYTIRKAVEKSQLFNYQLIEYQELHSSSL